MQVTSTLTGLITVEDVVYENVDGNVSHLVPSKALEGGTQKIVSETERKKSVSSSKSREKGNRKKNDSLAIHGNGFYLLFLSFLIETWQLIQRSLERAPKVVNAF
ncbi:hypothetical protein AAG906_016641 [Vitis piasezkii]